MASIDAFDPIHDFVVAQWASIGQTWPLYFENSQVPQGIKTPHVRVELIGDMMAQLSLGTGDPVTDYWREDGAVLAYFNVLSGSGSRDARIAATAFARMLRGVTIPSTTIRFGDQTIGNGAVAQESGMWWVMLLRAEWMRDEP